MDSEFSQRRSDSDNVVFSVFFFFVDEGREMI